MDVSITRYLKDDREAKNGSQKIHFRVCWAGEKVRFSSGLSVDPTHWYEGTDDDEDDNRWRVLKTAGPTAKTINRRLSIYTTQLDHFFEGRATVPTPAEVKAEISRIRVQELGYAAPVSSTPVISTPAYPPLSEFLEQYQKQLPGGLSKSTAWQIAAIRDDLDAFLPGMDWADLRINTLNQLKAYWQDEAELSDNSISSYFGSLRGALRYAIGLGCPVPVDYTLVSGKPAAVVRPALSLSQLGKFNTVELTEPHLRRENWLFRMACYTGLRHVDLVQVRRAGVRMMDGAPCLMALQQKSPQPIAIPLLPEAVRLLDEQPDGYKPTVTNVYNKNVKTIARLAGLTELTTVSSRYKGKLIHTTMELCDTIASHTARRTFATLMTEGGLNTRALQQLMGHASISSTEKYNRLPSNVIVSQTLEAWDQLSGRRQHRQRRRRR